MKLKKPQMIIFAFLGLWVIFIGWGMIETTLKLNRQKSPIEKPLADKPKIETPTLLVEEIPEEPEIPAVLTRTFKVKRTDFSDILPVMGIAKGETEIELRFENEGVIKSIYFREGDRIKEADLIACLDPKDAQLRIVYAQNKLAAGQASYQSSLKKLENHRKLYEAGAIIKSRLEEVELECESIKFQLESIKNEQELAKNQLEKTNLYAPIDGVMGEREAEEGEFITPEDRVASLLKIDNVLVEVGIVERDINKIKLGQKAKVFIDAYPDVTFEGIIDNIFPVVEGKSRTLTAKIKVPNPEKLLLPGMFCRAEIATVELNNVFLIPATSLITTEEGVRLVPVIPANSIEVDRDGIQTGTVQLRPVIIGYMTSDYVQITEGLYEGDLVVIEARGELKDYAPVRIGTTEELTF